MDVVVDEYLAAARKSMSKQDAAGFAEHVTKMYDQQARIAVRPTWVRYYDFGAGRMPKFLKELAARTQA